LLSRLDDPSAVLNALPQSTSTPELHLQMAEGENMALIEKMQRDARFPGAEQIVTIDGLRVEYADGFGLVRASNTTPVVVMRFEAETAESLKRIQVQFRNAILDVRPNAFLTF
jgi:phosphomannomutase/phosphoglucomutase